MKEEDYKFIVYSLGFTISNNKLLVIELEKELINFGKIKKGKELKNYMDIKFDEYYSEIEKYTFNDFNEFIEKFLIYIKNNFNKEDYYHLSFQVLNHFLGMRNLNIKFKNPGFTKIIENLYNEIIKESKNDFVKSHDAEGLLLLKD